ncbi:hypothetical protein D3C87_2005390 [compost metagenome]
MSSQHQLVFSDTVHPAAGAFEAEDQAAFELLFTFSQFILAEPLDGKLIHHFFDQLGNLFSLLRRSPRIYREHPAIRLGAMVRVDRISQPAFFADLLEHP